MLACLCVIHIHVGIFYWLLSNHYLVSLPELGTGLTSALIKISKTYIFDRSRNLKARKLTIVDISRES